MIKINPVKNIFRTSANFKIRSKPYGFAAGSNAA